MSRYEIMIHEDGAEEDGPRYEAERDGDALFTTCRCPRCGHAPLAVQAFEQTTVQTDRYEFCAVHCVACGKHVGTARYELATIFGRRADEEMHSNRWRVYGGGGRGQEQHGDTAAKQFAKEVAIGAAKRGHR